MKVLVKIGVLLLMIALLFAAFVLPKFVQRTEPPMPEEDLAAALAAVELGEGGESSAEAEPVEEVEEENPLRSDEQFTTFFAALDEENFEASSEELVKLSGSLEPEIVDQLTAEMEQAVASMGAEPEEESQIAMLDLSEATDVKSATNEETPGEAEDIAPAGDPAPAVVVAPKPKPKAVDPAAVVAFFALVQSGDFETAASELKRLKKQADPATFSSMQAALSSAEAREKALIASRKELEKSQLEMAKLQQESVTQLKESVAQLTEVTKAAQQATKEASRLKAELETAEAAAPKKPEATPKKQVKVPEIESIAFGFDSTFLNEASKAILTGKVVEALNAEERLTVQLRGHADSTGPSDYNGILAQARCEVVKDFLLEQGVSAERISLVSFGETQAASTGGSAEELRRVDVIFRSE